MQHRIALNLRDIKKKDGVAESYEQDTKTNVSTEEDDVLDTVVATVVEETTSDSPRSRAVQLADERHQEHRRVS